MDRTREGGGPRIDKTTGADTRHERNKAETTANDLRDPKEVWSNSETTPEADRKKTGSGPAKRVADAGDIGGGQVSPYGTETQADALAEQTDRNRPSGVVEKPKR